jgi:cytochrome oxidase assembly protein ShyY1
MDDDIGQMIQDCHSWQMKMNEWESNFIASIDEQYGKRGFLTPAQMDKLENIWQKVTK